MGDVPQFGEYVPGESYRIRPSAYGIAFDAKGRILLVTVPNKLVLPGGGLDGKETAEEAVLRECREETGYAVCIRRQIGAAGQYRYSERRQAYFNKRCTYFLIDILGRSRDEIEADHHPHWVPPKKAIATLTDDSHRWAVKQALKATKRI